MTTTRKKINSRDKGCRGERELAKLLTSYGFPARRGQQFSGSSDSPDVVVEGLPLDIHWECKWVESGNPYNWVQQAQDDCDGSFPVVAHKRNGKEWLAIVPLVDYLEMLQDYKTKQDQLNLYNDICESKVL